MHQHRISSAALPLPLSVPIRWTGKRIRPGNLIFQASTADPTGVSLYQIFKPWIVLIWTLSENHSIRLNVSRPLPRSTLSLDLIKSKIVERRDPLCPCCFLSVQPSFSIRGDIGCREGEGRGRVTFWRCFFPGWILIDYVVHSRS